MTDTQVPQGASVQLERVEGRLKVANHATIRAASGKLVVTEGAEFYGSALVEGNLECASLRVERSGRLRVTGDLTVESTLDVSNSIEVGGTMKADSVDVGGHVRARSLSCQRMRVGGTAEISESLNADSVGVGGKLEARGTVDIEDLQVGGKSEIGGGTIRGTIDVGGKFESTSRLTFGELRVYGVATLIGESKGKKLTVSGKLDAIGDLQCDQIDLSGVASVKGNCKSSSASINGKLDVSESLNASEGLRVYGAASVGQGFEGANLQIGGRFVAKKATVANRAEISGSSETAKGLRAKSVFVSSGTRCSGPIVAETVEIGDSGPGLSTHFWGQTVRIQARTSQVEDVYASTLRIGPGSRARRIFGETVELGSGCDVEEVTYVKELKMGDHVRIARPVRKVNKILEPPV